MAPRRWLVLANPGLTELISRTLDENKWITDLNRLRDLEPYVEDPEFRDAFKEVKRQNKLKLAGVIQDLTGVVVDPDSLFDVQIKRIHEYKRQLLNVMHIIHDYLGIVERGEMPAVARTYLFAGKAAPGYWAAKQIIKLIHSVADVVNNDEKVKDSIKIAFLPDYRVSLAQLIMPAADLSEQISMAGMEASGTGQHEAGHEWRAYHRDLRWSEHRDRRRSGRGQHLHLRSARGGNSRDAGKGLLQPARSLRQRCGRARSDGRAGL